MTTVERTVFDRWIQELERAIDVEDSFRVLDVDGEPVLFLVSRPQAGMAIGNADPADIPALGEVSVGRSRNVGATLEDPPSRTRLADYSDDDLQRLWRRRV